MAGSLGSRLGSMPMKHYSERFLRSHDASLTLQEISLRLRYVQERLHVVLCSKAHHFISRPQRSEKVNPALSRPANFMRGKNTENLTLLGGE